MNDPASVELGVKFTADTDGIVTGVRFYKGPQNTGIAHRHRCGPRPARSWRPPPSPTSRTTGWQTVTFASPVAVTAGTTYIASLPHRRSATTRPRPAPSPPRASTTSRCTCRSNGGVYTYAAGFPTNASNADYGVDVVFTVPASVVPRWRPRDPAAGDTGHLGRLGGHRHVQHQRHRRHAGRHGDPVRRQPRSAGTASLDAAHKDADLHPGRAAGARHAYTVTRSPARAAWPAPCRPRRAPGPSPAGGRVTCPCRLFASNADAGDRWTPVTPAAWPSASSVVPVGRPATSPACASTRPRPTPATHTGTRLERGRDPAGHRHLHQRDRQRLADGRRSPTRCRDRRHHLRRSATTRRTATTRRRRTTSTAPYVSGVADRAGRHQRRLPLRRRRLPDRTLRQHQLLGGRRLHTTAGADTTPPAVSASIAAERATSVATATTPTATFSEPVTAGLGRDDGQGRRRRTRWPARPRYDSASNTATFTPTAALAAGRHVHRCRRRRRTPPATR